MQFTRSLEVVAQPDVLVVGAGSAGITAAIAAGRTGASTVVVERNGFAGGFITAVFGPSFDGFVDLRSGVPIVGGLVFEFVRLATDFDGDLATTRFAPNAELGHAGEVPDRAVIRFSVERFKLAADRLMRQADVRVLYHTHVADVIARDGRVDAVVLANKAGLSAVRPRTVVDATGDADVAAWAGAPTEFNAAELQPMSLHFRVGNVETIPDLRESTAAVFRQAHADGLLGLYGGPWIHRVADGDYYFNATRVAGSPIDPDDLTHAEIQGREDAHLMFELCRQHIPAYRQAYLVATGPEVGARESRRIRGDQTLTADDVASSREQSDAVCKGAWWLDRHPAGGAGYHLHALTRPYDISYGSFLPQGLSNLWVAGRCHSADSAALASSRVTITCMGMGQAAGTAAAMAAQREQDSRELSVGDLQSGLLADGAIILGRARDVMRVGDDLADDVPQSSIR